MLRTAMLRLGRDQESSDRDPVAEQSESTRDAGSDAAIVARAKHDPAAFAPLYTRYAGQVFGYCLRRLGDREAAEDATSQVFVRVLAALPRCRGDQFRPWLFGIAHNTTTDALRTRARAVTLPEHDDRPDPGRLPEDAALDREGETRVHTLLQTLPPPQRQIVELRLAGLTGVEIAAVLGRSHGSVRIAQLRAYRTLRDAIAAGG